jgi:hypothetical protein
VEPFPEKILCKLDDDQHGIVRTWWGNLTLLQQQEITMDWDEKTETSFFAPLDGESSDDMPIVLGGRFVPVESPLVSAYWQSEYFDYLLNNPELLLLEQHVQRTFKICIAHEQAREVLRQGCIPFNFCCPFANQDCAIRHLLEQAPGQTLQLTRAT